MRKQELGVLGRVAGIVGAFNRSMQHHLGTKLFKGGVYDPTKTVETFYRRKDRHSGADGSAGILSTRLGALMAGHIPPFASCCCHVAA